MVVDTAAEDEVNTVESLAGPEIGQILFMLFSEIVLVIFWVLECLVLDLSP